MAGITLPYDRRSVIGYVRLQYGTTDGQHGSRVIRGQSLGANLLVWGREFERRNDKIVLIGAKTKGIACSTRTQQLVKPVRHIASGVGRLATCSRVQPDKRGFKVRVL